MKFSDVKWTQEELITIKEMFETASVAEMVQALPRHSWPGIRAKGKRLGLHREIVATRLPFSRGEGVCRECRQTAKLVNSQYVSGLCDPCYRVVYARIKYERRRNDEKKPPVQFYWMGGTDEKAGHVEPTDRSLAAMRESILARMATAPAVILPEIQDLIRAERRALKWLALSASN